MSLKLAWNTACTVVTKVGHHKYSIKSFMKASVDQTMIGIGDKCSKAHLVIVMACDSLLFGI